MINKREHCVDNINSRDEGIKFTVFRLSDQSIIMLKMTEIAHRDRPGLTRSGDYGGMTAVPVR